MNSNTYGKPDTERCSLSRIMGNAVLVVDGEKHRQQRKVMNPAFGAAQIREPTGIFLEKSIELKLRDIWATESKKYGNNGRIDVLSCPGRMTFNVIGLTGFNYEF